MSRRTPPALLPVLLLACDEVQDSGEEREPESLECHSLRTEDALPSATQTFTVGYDPVGERVLATNLGLPYLSVIDPASERRTDAIRWTTSPANNPRLVVDGGGRAWIGSLSDPSLVAVDVAAREVAPIEVTGGVNWLVALDDSVLIPQSREVVRVAADGTIVAHTLPANGGASRRRCRARVG